MCQILNKKQISGKIHAPSQNTISTWEGKAKLEKGFGRQKSIDLKAKVDI